MKHKLITCPTCSHDITIDDGFAICSKCCQKVVDERFNDEVLWFCDKCESFLNNQNSFDSSKEKFICKCGYENSLTYKNIDGIYDTKAFKVNNVVEENTKSKKRLSIVILLLIILIICVFFIINGKQNKKTESLFDGWNPLENVQITSTSVEMDHSSDYYQGSNYEDVKIDFENYGFTDITVEGEKNIAIGIIGKVLNLKNNEVVSVSINDDKNFEKGDTFDKDSKVIIKYYEQ